MNRDQALNFILDLLRAVAEHNASEFFLAAGFPPAIRIDGKISAIGKGSSEPLTPGRTAAIARALMNEKQAAEFEATKICNFAVSPGGIGRFRVSAFVEQERIGMVLRTIDEAIPKLKDLKFPSVLRAICMLKRGLVIVTGGTGQGKSTSLAAMIGYRNENGHGHIMTVEDPVEYLHDHKNCLVTHCEIGTDVESYDLALRNALRVRPDVILIGAIRGRQTMACAIELSATGRLCLATLHANSARQALERIVNFFPEERRQNLLMDFSLNIRALICQRLIPKANGEGRVAAAEIMLSTALIHDLIYKGDMDEIGSIMKKSRDLGMQTFDQHLSELYDSGQISREEALRNADCPPCSRPRWSLSSPLAFARSTWTRASGCRWAHCSRWRPSPSSSRRRCPTRACSRWPIRCTWWRCCSFSVGCWSPRSA